MNVVFVEPFFPSNQRHFARALAEVGATVIGVGESPSDALDEQLKGWLYHYEQVPSVTDVEAMTRVVRWAQDRLWVDRLEATIEAHTLAAAQVREACTIPGTSVRTAWLCRDKPSMKQALREAGVPTAASTAARSAAEAFAFAEQVGFPLILKPRSGAGASGTIAGRECRRTGACARTLRRSGRRVDRRGGVRRGSRGLLRHAHRRRAGRPGLRVALLPERARGHADPVDLASVHLHQPAGHGAGVHRAAGDGPSRERRPRDRDVGDAHGVVLRAEGAEVLRDRLPSAGRGGLGPLLRGQRDRCLPRVGDGDRARWHRLDTVAALRQRHGRATPRPGRPHHRLHAEWTSCSSSYGEWVIDAHLPSPGTATQAVEAGYMANAYVRMRHPDYDALRGMLDAVGRTLHVHAA